AVELLRELDIRYIALHPGASFRGLHDSLVNFGEGEPPIPVLCMHEETAVAIAHGYARATGRPMAAAVHNVVGLLHATMAIFNAWCDRVPVLVLGGTGPMDAAQRRPFIEWVHTALVQGNQVRDYTKWDDQPASVAAIPETMLRAYRMAVTEPQGPVYVCLDAGLQEEPVTEPFLLPDTPRFAPPPAPAPHPELLERAARLLAHAQWPVIVAEGTGRKPGAIAALVELAELLGAPVVDEERALNFPSTHPLDATLAREQAIEKADVLLALDASDIGAQRSGVKTRGGLTPAGQLQGVSVIHITMGDMLQKAWVADYQRLSPVDVPITADSVLALRELVPLCRRELERDSGSHRRVEERRAAVAGMRQAALQRLQQQRAAGWNATPVSVARVIQETWDRVQKLDSWSLVCNTARTSARGIWDLTEQEHFLGKGSSGGGLGFAPGGSVGAAIAFKETGRLPVAIIGDGEFLMAPTALWSAANMEAPLLTIIQNNRSYYNDESHQEHVARERGRKEANAGVGIRLERPEVRFTSIAHSFGVEGFEVTDPSALGPTLDKAFNILSRERRPVLVDVVTQVR
ncbi:MAG: thiamine pyrophosphate-binding protein, partial [Chloroflexota bacterium]